MTASAADGWWVYMVRCADQSLYTGVARDPWRRLAEHNGERGGRLAARYTRVRRPVELVYLERASDRAGACRREAAIKRLSRVRKLALVAECPMNTSNAEAQ